MLEPKLKFILTAIASRASNKSAHRLRSGAILFWNVGLRGYQVPTYPTTPIPDSRRALA